MRQKLTIFFTALILATSAGNSVPIAKQTIVAQAQRTSKQQDNYAQRVQDFAPARDLLLLKGVPFAPELLLRGDWKKLLAPQFAAMPEMQLTRQLSNKVEGVQLGDTLYFPEKVEITGDTVILANQVIFEGRHALLKGNHNIYFFPIVMEGVLGTSLETAMKSKTAGFTTIGFSNSSAKKRFVPRLLQADWSLTIDTSGPGRKEWLEKQKQKQQARLSKASLTADENTSGGPGATGATGDIGGTGASGMPDPSIKGDDGECGATTGLTGFPGNPGRRGDIGFMGREGGRAEGARVINATITNSSGTHNFVARGGDGGQGGRGGQGGFGGKGAKGGTGGTGADCTCN
ncbi:MAG: hypothetical protein ACRDRT_13030, partial [Pseudonocardiaceae bacterium]